MKLSAIAVAAFVVAASATAAEAQDQDEEEEVELEGEDDGEMELEPDQLPEPRPPGEVPDGAVENPNALPEFDARRNDGTKSPVSDEYPLEVQRRPLTLHAGMSQVALDVPVNFSPTVAVAILHARYGATREIEVGLDYAVGSLSSDEYTTGKAVSVEARYRVFDWLSAQLAIPLYLDPFAMGVTLGVPMKFRFGDKLALFGGHELLNVRIVKFVPLTGDPVGNEALVAADAVDTVLDRGELRFLGGAIYQSSPQLALIGEGGILGRDFGITDAGVVLRASLVYALSNRFDVTGRVGFDNLDNAGDTFGVDLVLTLRI